MRVLCVCVLVRVNVFEWQNVCIMEYVIFACVGE